MEENSKLGFQPILRVLSEQDKKNIFNAAMRVLEAGGMRLMHADALRLLTDAGCSVKGENQVVMPRELVEKALATAPENIPVFDREGGHVMDLGGRRSYFGTGSDLMWSFDAGQNERHRDCVGLSERASAGSACSLDDSLRRSQHRRHPVGVELHPAAGGDRVPRVRGERQCLGRPGSGRDLVCPDGALPQRERGWPRRGV